VSGLAPRERPSGRLDPIAATWGGLVGCIGLMAGTGGEWPLRLGTAALAFLVGGFLAGVRTSGRRPLHALAAGVIAYLLYGVFVGAARLIDLLGAPSAPDAAPDGVAALLLGAVWALLFALAGGALASSWLRPASRQRISA
jgi:hypothetical protein